MLYKMVFFLLGLISLAGCSDEGFRTMEAEDEAYLFFKIEGENENFQNYGSLFIKNGDMAPTVVAENVLESSFEYFEETEKILFIDSDFDLYAYDEEQGITMIASNVQRFDGANLDEEKIFYTDLDNAVHLYEDGSNRALPVDTWWYESAGNELYVVDRTGVFSVYDLDSGTLNPIDEDVYTFKLLTEEHKALITNLDNQLFYYDIQTKERVLIEEGRVFLSDDVTVIEDTLYYLQSDDPFQKILKRYTLNGLTESERVAETNVYQVVNGMIYFQNQDGTVFKWNPEIQNKEKMIQETSLLWEVTPQGNLVSMSLTDDLLWNEQLVAEDLQAFYSHSNGVVVYSIFDTLYRLDETGKSQVVMEDMSDYTSAHYNGSSVYYNTVQLADVIGVWYFEGEGQTGYLEITDSLVKNFPEGIEKEVSIMHDRSHKRLDLLVDGQSWWLTLVGEGLELDAEGERYVLTRATKEETEKFYEEL